MSYNADLFAQLRDWCKRDPRRHARLSVTERGYPEVHLYAGSDDAVGHGVGKTYDDAVQAAIDSLPAEVLR